jgi:class 3 adenylate cyclase
MARRRAGLRPRLAVVLIGVCLLSLTVLGVFNYFTTRDALDEAVEERLSGLQTTAARRIADGLQRLEGEVAAIARTDGVATALARFTAAFEDLDRPLSPAQERALREWYEREMVAALDTAGLDSPQVEELLPRSGAGRYLQYHYLVDASQSDPSAYREVYDGFHNRLVTVAEAFGFPSLGLVSTDGDVVYTTAARADLGTSVRSGPYADTGLADVLLDRLNRARTGDAVFVDFEPYLPAGGAPVMFLAAAVRDESQVVGAVVVEVPVAALDFLTTAGGEWQRIGLEDSGEVYVVGPDSLMRSDARLWLEDPRRYLAAMGDAGYDPALADAVERSGSTVFVQPVETEPVAAVDGGHTFTGATRNYLGEATLTSAGPVGVDGLEWTIVADLAQAEADQPLSDYLARLLLLTAIVVPVVGLLGWLLAAWLAGPVRPLLTAADRVSEGDLDTEVGDLGRNEYGDLGRQLDGLTAESRAQRERLTEEERRLTGVLLAALPPRVAEQVRAGDRAMTDVVDTATVVSLTVLGVFSDRLGQDASVELSAAISRELEALAERFGVERVRSASDHHLFTAGLGAPDPDVEAAAGFALAAGEALRRVAEEAGARVSYRAGLSAGDVIAGMFVEHQLSYGVIGHPAQQAMTLDAIAPRGQILVDEVVAAALAGRWRLEPATGLVDVAGEPIAASILTGWA